jgi:23S rRNA (adenine2030-N6)-methyltransferase
MNYRHAFHAGNFADVMKHVILVRVLVHLRRKETPFRVVDTHAGLGLYDLAGEEAERTQEWRDGVGRLDEPFGPEVDALLEPYRAILARVRGANSAAYPGSPLVTRELLRPQDRGVFVELHPADHDALAERFRRDRIVKVLRLDGWTALHSVIPPKERRGLVLIDPPYEAPGELGRLAAEMAKALRKWPTGIFFGWYPIKDPVAVEHAAAALACAAPGKGLRLELMVEAADDVSRLNGCGLFVLNPPWTLRDEAELILRALAERLARGGYGAYRCDALAAGQPEPIDLPPGG